MFWNNAIERWSFWIGCAMKSHWCFIIAQQKTKDKTQNANHNIGWSIVIEVRNRGSMRWLRMATEAKFMVALFTLSGGSCSTTCSPRMTGDSKKDILVHQHAPEGHTSQLHEQCESCRFFLPWKFLVSHLVNQWMVRIASFLPRLIRGSLHCPP